MRSLFAAFLFLSASFANAGTVDVRSGEHGDFTRLVFSHSDGGEWSVEQGSDATTYSVSNSADVQNYDLGSVYSRISKERLGQISNGADPKSVNLDLACRCVLETSVLANGMLVVDIYSRPAEDMADMDPEPAVVPMVNEVVEDQDEDRTDIAEEDASPPEPLETTDLAEIRTGPQPGIGPAKTQDNFDFGATPNTDADAPEKAAEEAAALDEQLKNQTRNPDAFTIGEQIVNDLAMAATQGLLEPAIVRNENGDIPTLTNPDRKDASSVVPLADTPEVQHEVKGKQYLSIGGVSCVPDKHLKIGNWVKDEENVFDVLSAARSLVFGEFDRVETDQLKAYIRTQIYFGFGVEARTASLLSDGDPDPVLIGLSYLVDLENDPGDTFRGQTNCEGRAALWSLLDLDSLDVGDTINTAAVMRTFETLPPYLRGHIGPTLAEKLSEFGQPDAARDLLRRLERTVGEETDEIALGRAKLDVQDGKGARATDTLTHLALESGTESIEAVIAAAQAAEQTGDRLPKAIVELAAAFSTEMRNTADGPKMWETHLRMLLINDEFDAAFEVLEDSAGIPEKLAHDMGDLMLKALLPSEDQVAFLKYAFRLDATGHRTTKPELDLSVARRMLDLGLSEAVLERLDRIGVSDESEEVRLLKARANLQLSRPQTAEAYLLGLQSDEANQLRAEVRAMMGDFASAQSAFASIGQEQEALNAAWLSGDWNGVADAGDSVFSPIAELIKEPQTEMDSENPSLGLAEQLTGESAMSRSAILDLLEATRIEGELE